MRVHIVFVFICVILSVGGSPLDIDDERNAAEVVKASETLTENKSTKTAELGKGSETDKKSEAVKDEETDDALELDISSEAVHKIESSKLNEPETETKLAESADKTLVKTDSAKTSDVPEGRPIAHANVVIQTLSIFQSQPLVPDSIRKVGPVELGLRNVVAASAAATEEYFMKMSALNAEILHLINSKSEILTSQTMNNLYEPLSKVEDMIKKNGECGKPFEASLNTIFKDVDSNLKSCSKNLSAIEAQYNGDNVGALTSLSFAADEMNNLPDSCEISQNFAVGTFCIVNNLAAMNDRVLSDVSFIKGNTAKTEEKIVSAIEVFDVCQREMSEAVTEKLVKLLKQVKQKCVERKNNKSK